jgi:hypothetical protein
MKSFRLLVTLISGLMLAGCEEPNSPLSDIILDDPSVIRPCITFSKSINPYGSVHYSITTTIYDRNNQEVILRDGSVDVNGKLLGTLYSARSYSWSSSKEKIIYPDSSYIVTITLGNGDQYHAWLDTPEKELLTFAVPDTHTRNQDLTVSWTDIDFRYPQTLEYSYTWSNTEGSGSDTKTFTIADRSKGNYTIGKSFFNYPEGIYEATLRIITRVNGTVDEAFMPGGYIQCVFYITSQLKIL